MASSSPTRCSSLPETAVGDVLPAVMAATDGSATLAYGASQTFTVNYTAPVANAGVVIANTVSVSASDDGAGGGEATASASDSATYQNVNTTISITKSHAGTINEGTAGQVLTYSFTVSNTSTATTDPVTVTSLSDSVLGDLLAAFKAANGGSAVIGYNGSVTFSVNYTAPVANAGVVIANTVSVSASDDDTGSSAATRSEERRGGEVGRSTAS